MTRPMIRNLLLCFALLLSPQLGRAEPGEQVPQWTQDGQLNLTHEWIEHGGARLYWNSLLTPRQVRLVGMRFKDPADRPFLMLDEPVAQKPAKASKRRRAHRRSQGRAARSSRAQTARPTTKPAHTSAKLDVKRDKPASGQRQRSGLAPLKPVPPVGVPLQ
ncbi:MAG: hypothetical protein K6G15_10050 [Desulfovibrio sp.]|nr:hypothetical protein [Desulfovibrio sp.]